MIIQLLCLLVTSVAILYAKFLFGRYRREINKWPGPPTQPLIGNFIGTSPPDILKYLFTWWAEYGKDCFRIWLGFDGLAIISNPKDVEVVLSSTQILKKSVLYDFTHPWLGQGLLTSYGAHWHSHRKIITPSFHFKILVDFLDTINKSSTKFIGKLHEISQGDNIFDIQSVVCNCTLDAICETAMGVSINAMDSGKNKIGDAFKYMCYSIQMRVFNPLIWNNFIFTLMPEYKRYSKSLNILKDFTVDVINERRKLLDNEKNVKTDDKGDDDTFQIRQKQVFLDTLLTSTIDGKPLSIQEIFEETSTFMFEGHDTTASGLTFAIHLLSRHPAVQEKVFEEQFRIFGDDLTRNPSYNDIQDMKYLDQVIKEAQRLYPSVPMIARCAERDFEINGRILPKGATVTIFIFAMGYNEKVFKDPYKFDPERFDPDKNKTFSPYEYVPFSAGPRNCVGQKFALLEMKSIISKVVRSFKILPPEDGLYSLDGFEPKTRRNKYDPVLSSTLTLNSDNGVHVRLRKRTY